MSLVGLLVWGGDGLVWSCASRILVGGVSVVAGFVLLWNGGMVMVAGGVSMDWITLDDVLLLFAGAGEGELVGDGDNSPGIGGMGRGGGVGPGSGSWKWFEVMGWPWPCTGVISEQGMMGPIPCGGAFPCASDASRSSLVCDLALRFLALVFSVEGVILWSVCSDGWVVCRGTGGGVYQCCLLLLNVRVVTVRSLHKHNQSPR